MRGLPVHIPKKKDTASGPLKYSRYFDHYSDYFEFGSLSGKIKILMVYSITGMSLLGTGGNFHAGTISRLNCSRVVLKKTIYHMIHMLSTK